VELVYLWVEEYKNIKNQGFNFSPRFTCKYEDGELTIHKKEHVSIFPENINITAIVGENGSGKTAILHELLNVGDIKPTKRTKIYAYNKQTEKVEHISYKILHKDKTKVILFEEDRDSLSYYNAYSVNSLIHLKDDYKRNNTVVSLLGYDKNQYNLKNLTFIPTHLELALTSAIDVDLNNLLSLRLEIEDIANNTIHPLLFSQNDIHKLKQFLQEKLRTSITEYNDSKDISHYMYLKAFCYQLYERYNLSIEILKELHTATFKIDDFAEKLFKEIFSLDNQKDFRQKIEELNKVLNNKKPIENKFIFELENNNKEIELILLNADRYFFNIDFFKIINQTNVYFKHLSSGEQKLVLLFGKLNYVVRKIFWEDKDNFILLLDEPDAYLHPKWQKDLISYFLNFIQNNKILNQKNIHIVINSHSPFILSDIPKENVIFLEKGKQVNPFENKQTFGANIHTLLSHGFFMQDGLMGEFAKGKIDEIIKNLKDKKYSPSEKEKKEVLSIINIIGEEFLRTKLLDIYYKKFDDDFVKKQRKKDLLEQQKKIQKELESL
jgi:predicted ATP-dependent endonuclease of OLD family